jgi:hypothetical protein
MLLERVGKVVMEVLQVVFDKNQRKSLNHLQLNISNFKNIWRKMILEPSLLLRSLHLITKSNLRMVKHPVQEIQLKNRVTLHKMHQLKILLKQCGGTNSQRVSKGEA